MYLGNSNVFGATYCPRQDLYTNIFNIKTFVERKHKKPKTNLKIVLTKNSKFSFCNLSNCLVTVNKELDNRKDCFLEVNRI